MLWSPTPPPPFRFVLHRCVACTRDLRPLSGSKLTIVTGSTTSAAAPQGPGSAGEEGEAAAFSTIDDEEQADDEFYDAEEGEGVWLAVVHGCMFHAGKCSGVCGLDMVHGFPMRCGSLPSSGYYQGLTTTEG